jgi:hypothetical protein
VYTTTRVIPDWVGDFGVEFSARDWDVDLAGLKVTARDVRIARDGRADPVLTADAIEFDGSLRTITRGLFSPGAYYHHITIRGGELRLEQSRTGEWNWREFLDAVPADRRDAALNGLYQVGGLFLDDLRVVYTEHVSTGTATGGAELTAASVYVDGVEGSIVGLAPAHSADDRPTRIQVTGRVAGGRLDVTGDAALVIERGPFFAVRIRLDTIGMAALSRMVPTTRVQPLRGTITGLVSVARTNGGLTCESRMSVDGLELGPNPGLVDDPAEFARIERELIGYRVSGPYDACGTPSEALAEPVENAHTVSAQMAGFHAQTTESAPASVRVLAALDQRQLAGVVGSRIVGGLKSVGGGLRRVFGGSREATPGETAPDR